MDSGKIETIYIEGKYRQNDDSYQFVVPKHNITMLHNVWLDELNSNTIKYAQFSGGGIEHEQLNAFAIETSPKTNPKIIPFFFTKAHGGFPMVETYYEHVEIDIVLKEPRDHTAPLRMGMCVSVEPNQEKFDKCVENAIASTRSVKTYPNTMCRQGQLTDNCFETCVNTSSQLLFVVFRVRDADGHYVRAKDVRVKCLFDSVVIFELRGDYLASTDVPFRQNQNIMVHSFVPDPKNLPTPKNTNAVIKDFPLRLEFAGQSIDSIELLCVRNQDVVFGGGTFGIQKYDMDWDSVEWKPLTLDR